MKLYITDKGDETVGVFGQTWTIEAPFEYEAESDDCEWFRENILEIYKEFAFGAIVAVYDFEQKIFDEQ